MVFSRRKTRRGGVVRSREKTFKRKSLRIRHWPLARHNELSVRIASCRYGYYSTGHRARIMCRAEFLRNETATTCKRVYLRTYRALKTRRFWHSEWITSYFNDVAYNIYDLLFVYKNINSYHIYISYCIWINETYLEKCTPRRFVQMTFFIFYII